MSKKFLLIVLCGVLLLGITGCGTQEKAKITEVNGETEDLTYSELSKIYEDNPLSFNEKYIGAKITVTGKIKEIKEDESITVNHAYDEDGNIYETDDITWRHRPMIELEDGWQIFIFGESEYKKIDSNVELSDLKVGDTIKVETQIVSIDESIAKKIQLGTLQITPSSGRDYVDETIKITKVE